MTGSVCSSVAQTISRDWSRPNGLIYWSKATRTLKPVTMSDDVDDDDHNTTKAKASSHPSTVLLPLAPWKFHLSITNVTSSTLQVAFDSFQVPTID
jgi:hypothetical protein